MLRDRQIRTKYANKGALIHHRNNSSETSAKNHRPKEGKGWDTVYDFSAVCRETFAFAHGINRKNIDSTARLLDQDGFGAKVHCNTGKSPNMP